MTSTPANGAPIWTAYEVPPLWACAGGTIPSPSPSGNPIRLIAVFLLVPSIHGVGLHSGHRLPHRPPLYRIAHALHHRDINPGPWSALSTSGSALSVTARPRRTGA